MTIPTLQIGNIQVNDVRSLFLDAPSYKKRDIGKVTHAIIHHSVTSEAIGATDSEELDVLRAIHTYHRNKGWPGIGYHLVIMPSGRMYATGGIEDIRYHASVANPYSWGVCLIGDFTDHQPSNHQLEAARLVINEMSYGLGKQLRIQGHFELNDIMPQEDRTACPGKMWDFWKGIISPAIDGEIR